MTHFLFKSVRWPLSWGRGVCGTEYRHRSPGQHSQEGRAAAETDLDLTRRPRKSKRKPDRGRGAGALTRC